MFGFDQGKRVIIADPDHPWYQCTGVVQGWQQMGILRKQGCRIRLDQGEGVPYNHECFADAHQMVLTSPKR